MNAASPLLARVNALLERRQPREAAALLAGAVNAGDPQAAATLAEWRIAGAVIPRDLSQARLLLAKAANGGIDGAGLLLASFLAAEVGGEADRPGAMAWLARLAGRVPAAQAQLSLLAAMDVDPEGNPRTTPVQEPIRTAPHIALSRAFLNDAECAYLIGAGQPWLRPSVVVDPASGRMIPHPVRRSHGMMFGVHDEDVVVNAINRRIAALSGTRFAQGEPLQLLRYGPGEEYRPHFDTLPNEENQRIVTVILYLSDGYDGGDTHFSRLDLPVRGAKGDALIFHNVDAAGRPEPLTLHAGMPVRQGTKIICTRWIRKRRFTYPPPRPLLPDWC
jgi:prolyl 4-hydroxylase